MVLRLVEEGRLRLEDPIARFLSASLVDRVHVRDGTSSGRRVTVRQLLNHTSGIPDYGTDPRWLAQVALDPGRRWTPRQLVEVALRCRRPAFAPGEGFLYSDTGYVLLGLIVERVTGWPLARAYRRLVLEPLGMGQTFLEGAERPRPGAARRAHQYLWRLDTFAYNPSFDAFGGGGLVSTARDLTRFVRGLFEGRLLRDRRTLAVMLEASRLEHYGLGLGRFTVQRATLWGHEGFFGAFAYYWPQRGVSITGSSNANRGAPELLGQVVRELERP